MGSGGAERPGSGRMSWDGTRPNLGLVRVGGPPSSPAEKMDPHFVLFVIQPEPLVVRGGTESTSDQQYYRLLNGFGPDGEPDTQVKGSIHLNVE